MTHSLRLRRAPLLVLLAASALLAACGSDSGSGPQDTRLTGTWTMSLANGDTLPYTLAATAAHTTEQLFGGTLVFGDTTVKDSVLSAMVDSMGTPVAVRTTVTSPRYTVQEDGLVLVRRPGPVDADYVDTGVVVGDTLRFKVHVLGDAPAPVLLLYARAVTP